MSTTCPKCHTDNPDSQKFCGECDTPLPDAREGVLTKTYETSTEALTRGSTFVDRYEIIEELGKGGMGKVYRVEDTKVKEEVALKLIKPEIAADKKTIERFRNELKFARKIRHKNVCAMFDLGEEKNLHYITMEYISGQDLKGLIRQTGQLTVGKAVSIAKQICAGLKEAHSLGIIHRDLKPNNIMIDRGGNVRIMDFGIARAVKGKSITGSGAIIGTPEYMSPEQVEGKDVDQRSDIYSLGIILYKMLTDRVPFEGDSAITVGVKQRTETPKAPKNFNERIPDDFNQLILKCLEKDRENRYQSAEELRSELENIEKGIPTTDRIVSKKKSVTSKEITVKFKVKKLLIPTIGIIALAVITFMILQFIPKKEFIPSLTEKPSLAILYFDNLSSDSSLDAWEMGLTELLIIKLAQSKYINVLDGNTVYSILKKLNLDEGKKYTKEDLVKVASEGRASHTLSGSILKPGQNIIITLSLQSQQTGEVINSLRIECIGEEEIISKVDEVSNQIKSDLDLSPRLIAEDINKELREITTAIPEAFKFYSKGREFFRNREWENSIAIMEKAVDLDPGIAMAYRSMAAASYNLRNLDKEKVYIQKAFELRERISERERYIIEGDFYNVSEKTFDKSIEAYIKLLELYPDDRMANSNLAWVYSQIEEWDKAIKPYEANMKQKVSSTVTYNGMSIMYEAKGLYDKAREILEDYTKSFSDSAFLRRRISTIYASQGEFDLALNEANKAFSLDPTYHGIYYYFGDIYLLKGDFLEAEKEFQKLADTSNEGYVRGSMFRLSLLYRAEGKFRESKEQIEKRRELSIQASNASAESYTHLYLCEHYLSIGDFSSALKENEKYLDFALETESLSRQRVALWQKGLAYIGMNSIDKAQETADELKEFIENGIYKKIIRFYYHLQGGIEQKKNNYSLAVEYFKKTLSVLPSQKSGHSTFDALFYDSLAFANFKAGDLENAQENYETIISLTWGRLYWGNIYAKAFYMLGKIHEQQGDKTIAIENYEKFLDLWKDADPGLPEVDDAKQRLAGLKE